MPQCLVSLPERLRLVSAAEAATEERAIVVPELPLVELWYHRAVVDDHRLSEHALVDGTGVPVELRSSVVMLASRALNSRVPTLVSFCWHVARDPGSGKASPIRATLQCDGKGAERLAGRSALVAASLEAPQLVASWGTVRLAVRARRQGSFWSCELD